MDRCQHLLGIELSTRLNSSCRCIQDECGICYFLSCSMGNNKTPLSSGLHFYPPRATCPTHLPPLDSIILFILFRKNYLVWNRNKRENIAHLRQQCHESKFVIFQEKLLKVLKCYDFLWVQRLHNCSPAASFCKLRYGTIPFKSASAKVSFCTNNSKMPNFELWHLCRIWAIRSSYCQL